MTAPPAPHYFTRDAMAARFELFIEHDEPEYAREAADEAFELLAELERELSRHIESSDVSRISRLRDGGNLRVSSTTFDCLQLGLRLQAETEGAFAVDTGTLVDRWLEWREWRQPPSENEIEALCRGRGRGKASSLILEETGHVVKVPGDPVSLDLGGIGKGYALDRMAELLREWSIDRALLHGGYSSVLALDAPENTSGWAVDMRLPAQGGSAEDPSTRTPLRLKSRAVGSSGLKKGPHIIDPRTARPPLAGRRAWAFAESAARADALSTAFLVLSPSGVARYCHERTDVLALLTIPMERGGEELLRLGDWTQTEIFGA